jgi:hypothetical protein
MVSSANFVLNCFVFCLYAPSFVYMKTVKILICSFCHTFNTRDILFNAQSRISVWCISYVSFDFSYWEWFDWSCILVVDMTQGFLLVSCRTLHIKMFCMMISANLVRADLCFAYMLRLLFKWRMLKILSVHLPHFQYKGHIIRWFDKNFGMVFFICVVWFLILRVIQLIVYFGCWYDERFLFTLRFLMSRMILLASLFIQ